MDTIRVMNEKIMPKVIKLACHVHLTTGVKLAVYWMTKGYKHFQSFIWFITGSNQYRIMKTWVTIFRIFGRLESDYDCDGTTLYGYMGSLWLMYNNQGFKVTWDTSFKYFWLVDIH